MTCHGCCVKLLYCNKVIIILSPLLVSGISIVFSHSSTMKQCEMLCRESGLFWTSKTADIQFYDHDEIDLFEALIFWKQILISLIKGDVGCICVPLLWCNRVWLFLLLFYWNVLLKSCIFLLLMVSNISDDAEHSRQMWLVEYCRMSFKILILSRFFKCWILNHSWHAFWWYFWFNATPNVKKNILA